MNADSGVTVYLFRHGKVGKDTFDQLSESGRAFRDQLPLFFESAGVTLSGAFFDGSVGRCPATIDYLSCSKEGYGSDRAIRTLNAVLSGVSRGHYAICCRGDSIESGQLYHVAGFELHTPFYLGPHGDDARAALAHSYHMIYCLASDGLGWRQVWKRGPITPVV